MYLIKALGKSLVAFLKDDCYYLAASISYFSIVSLVPLSLLVITLFGYLIGENQELYKFTLSGLINLFPAVTAGITKELRNIITYRGISVILLFIYSFLSLQLFYSMERALNVIFKVPKKRHILLSIFWSILIVTFVIIFLLLSFTVSSTAGLLKKYSINLFGIEVGYKAAILIGYIAPFLLVLLTFTAIFIIMPRVKISWRYAFTGAMIVTVLWEMSKYFFTWYVKNIIHVGTIYGSLTTFVLFLIWIFYSSCIFLLGAEFVNIVGRKG
jgi:membrane protein